MGEAASWSPWRHLREHHPHVTIWETELPGDLLGCLDHNQNAVYVDSRLTCHEKRATVAHEVGHLELDTCVNGLWTPAAEWKVNRWAARHLIPVEALASAMRWTSVVAELADELFVDEKTVRDRFRCMTDAEQDLIMALVGRFRLAAA